MARRRWILYEAWRQAEGEHDLFVARLFNTERERLHPRTVSDREAVLEIARLREAANEAHDAWVRDLLERAPEPG
ncbi:MAG: hypothetical protein IT299_10320 [Dehalococcoidia bacterium]|nr:hypothetical protein [Dehalococcoidia bacterium]